jgi:predicted phosphodiesterase
LLPGIDRFEPAVTNPARNRRVAVIADVHANVVALDAVLAELQREPPDALVVCGDVVGGPEPGATLERLTTIERAHFVRGNADREVVEAFDEARPFDPGEPSPARKAGAWNAERITHAERDFLASFAERVVLTVEGLGEVLFCHGSPRSDEEIVTSLTPEPRLRRVLAGVEQGLVVCAHTHVQFDRVLDATRIVNAGSVGTTYQGQRGAFWLTVGPDVEFRRTDYDYGQAAERIRSSDYWDAASLAELILDPPDPREVEEFFERAAADRDAQS